VLLTCSQDSLKLAGWGSRKPIPGAYVLDSAEVATARNAIASYNSAIATVAALPTHNALVVDVNALYGKLKSSGLLYAGQTVTSDYVKGGVFSLDGITPCAKGQGIIANEFLRIMNSKLGTSIPYVDIGSLPGIAAPL
jgi:hypothetical protein